MRGILLPVALSLLVGCEQQWDGFVYPDRGNLTNHIGVGTFNSLEECRSAAVDRLERMNALYTGDYECGLNCDRSEFPMICEKTER